MARILMRGGNPAASTSWFGTGEDGDLVVSGDVRLPVAADTGHIFKQYLSLTINAGAILAPQNRCAGMVIAVRGDCTINGVLDMSRMCPRRSEETETIIRTQGPSARWLQKIAHLRGGPGGKGGDADFYYSPTDHYSGTGGPGGDGEWCGGGYGGGGAGGNRGIGGYNGGASRPRPPASIQWPYPSPTLQGGGDGEYGAGASANQYSGRGGSAPGGAGAFSITNQGGPGENGDAYGGGLIVLIVGGRLIIGPAGKIISNGGDGGSGPGGDYSGAGGGGGGGIVALLLRNRLSNGGNITAYGGKAGSVGHAGVNGSIGTIYNAHLSNDGTVTPW